MRIIENYMDRIDYYDWIDSRHVPAWRLSIVTEEYNSAYDSDYVFYKNNFAIDYEGLGDFLSFFARPLPLGRGSAIQFLKVTTYSKKCH